MRLRTVRQGTGRDSPSALPLGGRRSRAVPLSVHSLPTTGATSRTVISPQTSAGAIQEPLSSSQVNSGRRTSDHRRFTASSGRSAEKYITAKKGLSRSPLRPWAATASKSLRACAGLGTERLSTKFEIFGGAHLTAPEGLR